jgi:hypothetical protein
MIAQARRKAAERSVTVEWVVTDGRAFRLQKQFPCIYMLMNAFQFFLTRADQEAMLARVLEHLRPEGRFIFCARTFTPHNLAHLRNPEPQTDTYTYATDDGKQLVITDDERYDPITQIQHFDRQYVWLYPEGRQESKMVRTALRYVFPQEMEALLFYNGFQIDACYGNWQQELLTATSPSMIYVCQRRD